VTARIEPTSVLKV